jgi:hypothetical protein
LSVHAFFSSLLHEIRTDSIQNASLRQWLGWKLTKSAREVKLFPNHCDSRLFLGLGSHGHNFDSVDRKCDCEGLTGHNLKVIIFQNYYHEVWETSSLLWSQHIVFTSLFWHIIVSVVSFSCKYSWAYQSWS